LFVKYVDLYITKIPARCHIVTIVTIVCHLFTPCFVFTARAVICSKIMKKIIAVINQGLTKFDASGMYVTAKA